MQYIDNDMDDLFRKAEENYPLQTGGANWEAVQAKLAGSDERIVVAPSKKSDRKFLWLLLLALVPVVAILYNSNYSNHSITQRNKDSRIENTVAPQKKKITNDVAEPFSGKKAILKKNNINPGTSDVGSYKIKTAGSLEKAEAIVAAEIYKTKQQKKINPENTIASNSDSFTTASNSDSHAAVHKINTAATIAHDDNNDIPVDSTTAIRQPKQNDSVLTSKSNTPEMVKTEPQKKLSDKRQGFYYGVLAAPDVSTIKSQKVNNIGYTAGGLLGYRINKHWAIEAGVLWDKKKYYSDGKFFDKSRTGIPSGVSLKYLDGACDMFEFPLAVRYDIVLKRSSIFFTGGLTSYVMKNEDYAYEAEYGGNYYKGTRSYKNSGNHLFSNLQLSAGYNYHFSRKASLRIEPYIKLPVKDIGIGNMPISSKGLYIGFFRNLR